jgi:hypothetical protein
MFHCNGVLFLFGMFVIPVAVVAFMSLIFWAHEKAYRYFLSKEDK